MFSVENSVVKTLSYGQVRVLAMKLQLPLTPMNGIKRQAAIQSFSDQMQHAQMACLVAASGYGKSSLLSQFLYSRRQYKECVAWLTLDPKENDAKRFLTYLVSAFNHGDSQLGRSALMAIDGGQTNDEIFNCLMNELSSHEGNLHLVLDDVHHLHNKDVLNYIQWLMDYLPENTKLYFTSQCKLPLNLARYQANQTLLLLKEDKFALTQTECAQWLEKKLNKELSFEQVKQAYDLSLGWFDGLNILLQYYEKHQCFDIHGGDHLLVEYFQQQWESKLNRDEILCATQVAILQLADANYIQAVFAGKVAEQSLSSDIHPAELLENLVDRHVLLFRHINNHRLIKAHPLLSLFLHRHLLPTYLTQVYHAASLWLNQQGLVMYSVEMALKSEDKQLAAGLLQVMAENILEEQDLAKLLEWKQQLPDDVICVSPRLIIIFSWALALALQLDDAERLIARMDSIAAENKDQITDEVAGQLFAIRAYIARNRGNLDNAGHLCHQAVTKLSEDTYMARALTYMNLSNISMTKGILSDARKFNRLAFEAARAAGSIHLEMLAIHELARIEQTKGNLNLALKLIDEGLLLAERLKDKQKAAGFGRLLIYKGYIVWLQNKIEDAKAYLQQGVEVSLLCHDAYFSMGTIVLSNIARQANQAEQAFDHLSNVEAQLQRWAVPAQVFQPWLAAMRSNLLIDQGQVDEAQASLKELLVLLKQNPYSLSPEHYPALRGMVEVFFVRARSIAGHHKEALKLLDDKLPNTINHQQGFALTFVYLMRALLRFQLGKEDESIQDFKKAVSLAQNNQCLMPFIEYSAGMTSLYGRLPPAIKQSPFVQSILQNIEIGEEDVHNQAFAQAKSVISQREFAVLELIAQGLTNQAIAERLFISLHTVKTHTRRINAKLGVNNRTQALIRAKEIGLLL